MIRTRPFLDAVGKPCTELTIDLTTRTDQQAIRAMIGSLGRSGDTAHQTIADELQYRMCSGATLARVTLDRSAVLRLRGTLRFVYSKRGAFPNHGWRDLARAIERTSSHILPSPAVARVHG